jgi:hypothetical protein
VEEAVRLQCPELVDVIVHTEPAREVPEESASDASPAPESPGD